MDNMNNICYGCFGAAMGDCTACTRKEGKPMKSIIDQYKDKDWVKIVSRDEKTATRYAEMVIEVAVKEIYHAGYEAGVIATQAETYNIGYEDGKKDTEDKILKGIHKIGMSESEV